MMDGNNQMMPQDGMDQNNGQHMYQNCQNQMMPQGQPGQMPQGGQPNGNAPQPPVEQGAPQTTQIYSILLILFSHNTFRARGHESAFIHHRATHSM
ncbi:Uncharacterised protein [Veillonella atypica]|nr:Uncharacterised protein [Veillonella atypica]